MTESRHAKLICSSGSKVSENTLRQYLHEYQEGGIDRLKEVHFNKPQSELVNHQKSLETYFEEYPPATVNEAVTKIKEITGIRPKSK